MKSGGFLSLFARWKTWGALTAVSLASVPGCDPDVQRVLVDGMEAAATAAATAIIQALFQTITPDNGVPTVMLDLITQAVSMRA